MGWMDVAAAGLRAASNAAQGPRPPAPKLGPGLVRTVPVLSSRLELALQSLDDRFASNQTFSATPSTVGYYTVDYTIWLVSVFSTTPNQAPGETIAGITYQPPIAVGSVVFYTSLPAGETTLAVGQPYYVINVTNSGPSYDFQVSATPGGTAITPNVTGQADAVFSLQGVTHTLFFQPQRYGESWTIDQFTAQTTSQLSPTQLGVYRGAVAPSQLLFTIDQANFSSANLSAPFTIYQGEPLIFQFANVDPSTIGVQRCTVYLTGTGAR